MLVVLRVEPARHRALYVIDGLSGGSRELGDDHWPTVGEESEQYAVQADVRTLPPG